ncbi:hypothetical protein MMC25_008364 [Agyrium rufum]|nr:hypothetical protein [Agyrium rufum]
MTHGDAVKVHDGEGQQEEVLLREGQKRKAEVHEEPRQRIRLKVPGGGDIAPGAGETSIYHTLAPEERFTHGAHDWIQEPRILFREIAMVRAMNIFTDKPDWDTKVFDDAIVAEWQLEALGMPLISMRAWLWCLKELRDKAKRYENTGTILALDASLCVLKSDTLVSTEFKKEITTRVTSLREDMMLNRTLPPVSQTQVQHLIDPFLYPLVYGRTKVLLNGDKVGVLDALKSFGGGETIRKQETHRLDPAEVQQNLTYPRNLPFHHSGNADRFRWSICFQRLPCDVEFTGESGTHVRITSYINNLHPRKYQDLSTIIEKLVAVSIQPWNDALVKGQVGRIPLRVRTYGIKPRPQMAVHYEIPYLETLSMDERRKLRQAVRAYWAIPFSKHYQEDEHEHLALGHLERNIAADVVETWKIIPHIEHPQPGIAVSYEDWKRGKNGKAIVDRMHLFPQKTWTYPPLSDHRFYDVTLQDTFREKGLQVLVEISGIELTPEAPRFTGTEWQLNGLLNEHIVASATFFYQVENVDNPRVAFRQETAMNDEEYGPLSHWDTQELSEAFGFDNIVLDERGDPNQELGSICIKEGRFIAWPNAMQHKFEPFTLSDTTRSGYCRYIQLSLVDPHYRILSTQHVPPQQHDWWAEAVREEVDLKSDRKVPQEIIDMILDNTKDWPIGLDEARKIAVAMEKDHTLGQKAVEVSAFWITLGDF